MNNHVKRNSIYNTKCCCTNLEKDKDISREKARAATYLRTYVELRTSTSSYPTLPKYYLTNLFHITSYREDQIRTIVRRKKQDCGLF